MSAPSPYPRVSAAQVLVVGLWIGLLTGYAEVIIMGLKLYVIGEFVTLSRHAAWMAPLAEGVFLTLVAGGLVVVGKFLPGRLSLPAATGILAGLGILALLLPFRQIHLVATLLIAAGVGVQVARRLRGREAGLLNLARRSATGLVFLTVLVASILIVRERGTGRSARAQAAAGAPNILLIILDTVRARNLGLYGYQRPTTPGLDQWASGGTVFERVIAPAPWTLPSHASMFTGRLPTELEANWNTPLEREPVTLAEIFSERGYATAGFVANHRYAGWETGLGRGFHHYEDYHITLGEALRSAALPTSIHKTLVGPLGLPPLRPRSDARDVTRWFLHWLDGRQEPQPFFVFLNYLDAHDPYDPSPGFQRRFAPGARAPRPRDGEHVTAEGAQGELRLYDAAIAYLDSVVSGLLRELDNRGVLANTLVVLTSDHGEEFAEHEIMGHAASLYRPSVEVPLVLWRPGRVPPGRIRGPVSLNDLAATIMDLSGQPDPRIPGRSLRRYWESPTAVGAEGSIVSHIRKLINQPAWWPASQGDMLSLVRGGYRYIVNRENGREELFNFETDPQEQHDLSASPVGDRELPRFRRAVQGFTRSAPRR